MIAFTILMYRQHQQVSWPGPLQRTTHPGEVGAGAGD